MHWVLQRQLKKLGLDKDTPPSPEAWSRLLDRICHTYTQTDQERYLLERSLLISSSEMKEQYTHLQETSATTLKAERDRLQTIIDTLALGFCLLSPEGIIVSINTEAQRLFNCEPEALVGCSLDSLMVDEDPAPEAKTTKVVFHAALTNEVVLKHRNMVLQCVHRHPFLASCAMTPVYEEDILTGFAFVFQDVTDRRAAEEEIKNLKEFYEQIIEEVPIELVAFDRQGRFVYASKQAISNPERRKWVVGKTQIEYYERYNRDVFNSKNPNAAAHKKRLALVGKTLEQKKTQQIEESFITPDGRTLHFMRYMTPIKDEQGNVRLTVGVGVNITEQKQAEEALRQSEKLHSIVANNFPNGNLYIFDRNLRYKFADGTMLARYGLSKEQVEGKTVHEVWPEDVIEDLSTLYQAVLDGETLQRERQYLGHIIHLHLLPIRDENGHIYAGMEIAQDITHQKQYEKALIEAKERAEEAAQLKSNFLANMSHEIRTPLTSILGFASLLRDEITNGEVNEYADYIMKGGNRLMGTLNSVLDLAQLDSKTLTLRPESVELSALLLEETNLLLSICESKGLTMHVACADTPVYVELDRGCWHRIIQNLVSNAIKFTSKGFIRVSLDATPDQAIIRVQDTGQGIDVQFLPHLFHEFEQESKGFNRSHEGVGLGLTITKRLVDLLKGTIEVESTPGIGSTFTVKLPRKPAEHHPMTATEKRPHPNHPQELRRNVDSLAPPAA